MLNPTLSPSASRRSSSFSRRDLLKGLTAGLGGALAAPFLSRPAAGAPVTPTLSSNPALLLTGNLVNKVTATGLASYGPGWIFVRTQDGSGNYDIEFVDVHSSTVATQLQTVFSFADHFNLDVQGTPFLNPVVDDTYVYTASGTFIYSVPLANTNEASQWASLSQNVTGSLVLAGGFLLVLTQDGTLHTFNAKLALSKWSKSVAASGDAADFTVSGNVVYVSAHNQLSAYSLLDGSAVPAFSVSSAPNGKLTVSSDSVFVTSTDGVRSYSLNNGSQNWFYSGDNGSSGSSGSFNGPGTLPATLYTGFLYAVDNSGQLHEIQAGSTQGQATSRSPLPLSPDIDPTQPLIFEDGVVYGASPGGTSNLTVYPMVLATGNISAYSPNFPGRFLRD